MTVTIPFVKLHGAGNDYVLLDAVREPNRLTLCADLAAPISNRNRGVGSDGLIALATDAAGGPLRMHMWNADGSRGAICGNGLRCAARFAFDEGLVEGRGFEIASDVGVHAIELLPDDAGALGRARVAIGTVTVDPPEVLELGEESLRIVPGSAGNPHAVVFVDCDPERVDVLGIGAALQSAERFPDGVNVEFVRPDGPNSLIQRTFERGSGETLACGSGATLAAAAAMQLGIADGPTVAVQLRGGVLHVTRRDEDGSFELTGPVARVFEGSFRIVGESPIPSRHTDC